MAIGNPAAMAQYTPANRRHQLVSASCPRARRGAAAAPARSTSCAPGITSASDGVTNQVWGASQSPPGEVQGLASGER